MLLQKNTTAQFGAWLETWKAGSSGSLRTGMLLLVLSILLFLLLYRCCVADALAVVAVVAGVAGAAGVAVVVVAVLAVVPLLVQYDCFSALWLLESLSTYILYIYRHTAYIYTYLHICVFDSPVFRHEQVQSLRSLHACNFTRRHSQACLGVRQRWLPVQSCKALMACYHSFLTTGSYRKSNSR